MQRTYAKSVFALCPQDPTSPIAYTPHTQNYLVLLLFMYTVFACFLTFYFVKLVNGNKNIHKYLHEISIGVHWTPDKHKRSIKFLDVSRCMQNAKDINAVGFMLHYFELSNIQNSGFQPGAALLHNRRIIFSGEDICCREDVERKYFVVQSTYTLECFNMVRVRVQLLV